MAIDKLCKGLPEHVQNLKRQVKRLRRTKARAEYAAGHAKRLGFVAAFLFTLCAFGADFTNLFPEPVVIGRRVESVPQHLQEISVTVKSGDGTGSGVLITRVAPDSSMVNFVLTAGHVIADLRREREILTKDGSKKTVVEFDDAKIMSLLLQDGRIVGRTEFDAEVVRYSDSDRGDDLALLRVRKRGLATASTKFYREKDAPVLGTRLFHVGSLLGEFGANSLTDGIYSQHGRLIDKRVYDQVTVVAFPGSSGGGVFLADGRYVGMLVRGANGGFHLISPIRRIEAWIKREKIEWVLDDSVPLPESAYADTPLFDDASSFSLESSKK